MVPGFIDVIFINGFPLEDGVRGLNHILMYHLRLITDTNFIKKKRENKKNCVKMSRKVSKMFMVRENILERNKEDPS